MFLTGHNRAPFLHRDDSEIKSAAKHAKSTIPCQSSREDAMAEVAVDNAAENGQTQTDTEERKKQFFLKDLSKV